MKDVNASMCQLSWSIPQAAYLSGNSAAYIKKLITAKGLTVADGDVIQIKCRHNSRYLITRKGMTKLTGYQFPRVEYTQLAQELLRLAKV